MGASCSFIQMKIVFGIRIDFTPNLRCTDATISQSDSFPNEKHCLPHKYLSSH